MQNFSELSLPEPIMRAIADLGFTKPSAVQAEALPILLAGPTDFLGLAATGTGKTAAFAIPLLARIDPAQRGVQALVLCPTRELAVQVTGQINLLGKYLGVRALPIYGGTGYGDQIAGLKQGVNVVVGTPGRVVDHMQKGTLKLNQLSTLVLDEADEMISMGFKEELEAVLGSVPEGQANKWMFSATMSREVRRVADAYLKDPEFVQVNRTEMLPKSVEQIFYITKESNKPEVLCKIIDVAEDFFGIIFCQTKSLVTDLNQYLLGRGYRSDCLHGDMDQNSRERTMRAFRERKVRILVATDVACRGLDVNDISHVVNYSIPRELDNYVHRIGRTGRIGKAGLALSLVTNSHRGLISKIEHMTKSKMTEGKIPSRKEVGIKKLNQSLGNFQKQETHARAVELLSDEWKSAIESLDKTEIVGRFLSILHPEVFSELEQPGLPGPAPSNNSDRAPRARENRYSRDSGPRRDSAPRRDYAPRRDSGAPYRDSAPRREAPQRREREASPRSEAASSRDSAPRKDFGQSRGYPRRNSEPKQKTFGSSPRRDFTPSGDRERPRFAKERPQHKSTSHRKGPRRAPGSREQSDY